MEYFQSIISQDVAFFDDKENSPGVLAAKLVKHPDEIEDLLGRNLPVILIILTTMIACSLLSLIIGWKFGLVCIFGCLFPVCVAGYVRIQLDYTIESRTSAVYYRSASFAAEAVGAMRTVVSLSLQDVISAEYQGMLQGVLSQTTSMFLLSFLFMAIGDSISIAGYALAFW